jgi:peptidoglycan-N-acetylglucosamine deacetylase
LPFQRLVYRPLLYLTVWRAVLLALVGRLASWGKPIRTGRLRAPA